MQTHRVVKQGAFLIIRILIKNMERGVLDIFSLRVLPL